MNEGTVKFAPSILAADFARLGQQVTEAELVGDVSIPAGRVQRDQGLVLADRAAARLPIAEYNRGG